MSAQNPQPKPEVILDAPIKPPPATKAGESAPPPTTKPADTPPPVPVATPSAADNTAAELRKPPTDPDGKPKKTPAEFRDERLRSKEERQAEERQKILQEEGVDQLKTEKARLESELAELRLKLAHEGDTKGTVVRELEETKALIKVKDDEIQRARQAYVKNFDVADLDKVDEEYNKLVSQARSALTHGLPDFIPTDGGTKQIFPEQIINSRFDDIREAMETYGRARTTGDATLLSIAVNRMAVILGSDAVKFGETLETSTLLPATAEAYQRISEAMRNALPTMQAASERAHSIRENAPKILSERIESRTTQIRSDLTNSILLPRDKAESVLAQNPTDARALLSIMAEAEPEIANRIKAAAAMFSGSFAVMGGFNLPLVDQSEAGIARHRNTIARHQQTLAEAMQYAVIGRMAGPILADYHARTHAAEARAGAVAGAAAPPRPGAAVAEETPSSNPSAESLRQSPIDAASK